MPHIKCFANDGVDSRRGAHRVAGLGAAATAASAQYGRFLSAAPGPGKGADLGRGPALSDAGPKSRSRRQDLEGVSQHASRRRSDGRKCPRPHWTRPVAEFQGEIVAHSVDELHSDNNKVDAGTALTERGTMIPGRGFTPNYHDVLTGSQPDGRAFPPDQDKTCHNWTSSTKGAAMVGHLDRKGLRDDPASRSWNSSRLSRGADGGCSQNDLRSTGGNGLLYCFAAD
jgi:hypothetical protein